jgi:AmmeMemoRadiSam system protein B
LKNSWKIKVMVRTPHVAGQFYEAQPERLKKQVKASFLHPLGPGALPVTGKKAPRDIVACISPHAGYMYSGMCAAHVYYELSKLDRPKNIVVLGPNHTSIGGPVTSSIEDWATPLGTVKINREGVLHLMLEVDEYAHRYEHSIEVQLPFLQYIYGSFNFIPVIISAPGLRGGVGIEEKIASLKDVLVIASSDFTHYEPAESADEKDERAIEAILKLDDRKFLETVEGTRASICGYAPIISAIIAAKALGANKGELLKYTTSGDITGDYSSVVAYAAIIFRK